MVDWTVFIWVSIAGLIYELFYQSRVVNILLEVEVVVKELLVLAASVDLHLDFEEVAQGHDQGRVF